MHTTKLGAQRAHNPMSPRCCHGACAAAADAKRARAPARREFTRIDYIYAVAFAYK